MNEKPSLREIVLRLEPSMRCNCDLDNWEPERNTGHSHVCRIHKAAIDVLAGRRAMPDALEAK